MSDTQVIIHETHDQPLSFADLGIPTGPSISEGVIGKSRRLKDLEISELLYVVLSCLSILATIVLSIYKMATISTFDSDFTFALILIVNAIFCTFYVVHGVLKERAYEIVIFMIAIFGILLYSIVNYSVQVDTRGPVKLSRLIIVCVMSPVLIGLSGWIGWGYNSSGNLIFRTIGANTELQSICKKLFMFLDCLKLDLQLGISMVIFILNSGFKIDNEDIVILSVGGVITLVWFGVGYFSTRHEDKVGSWIFIIGAPAEPAYVIFKMIQSKQEEDTGQRHLVAATIAAGVLALVTRSILMVLLYLVYKNYGKGLKEKEFGIKEPRANPTNESTVNNQSNNQ
ncbi:uncharacterized protein LOC126809052 isoform X1 [Patella vulgata]|uniref:uncharacterized protein LOC126809052 isoform X1 n=1 Tax=Patella vulgata TaxID=6465 RepID=UPI0024A85974|nr:uncharacterized protein LOC126809052 isoform X1 [Patella vulgata]